MTTMDIYKEKLIFSLVYFWWGNSNSGLASCLLFSFLSFPWSFKELLLFSYSALGARLVLEIETLRPAHHPQGFLSLWKGEWWMKEPEVLGHRMLCGEVPWAPQGQAESAPKVSQRLRGRGLWYFWWMFRRVLQTLAAPTHIPWPLSFNMEIPLVETWKGGGVAGCPHWFWWNSMK